MNTQDNETIFDRYLSGNISPEEKKQFNEKLKNDTVFKNEFDAYQKLSNQIHLAFLKEDLKDIHHQVIHNTKKPKMRPFFYAVASLICIGILAWMLFPTNSSTTPNQTFDDYFLKDPGLPTVMGIQKNIEFQRGMVLYKQGKYSEAKEKWLLLNADKVDNDTLQYYIAMTYLNEDNTDQALVWLQKESVRNSVAFQNEAIWYEALIYIKSGENKKALEKLEKIKHLPKSQELIQKITHK